MNLVYLVPARNPPAAFYDDLVALRKTGRDPIIVINDGSLDAFNALFHKISEIENCYVIRHVVNWGKGAALKTGLNHIYQTYPEARGVVTFDADGQHRLADITQLSQTFSRGEPRLTLGVRCFTGKVPFRSAFGNKLTKLIFRFFTNIQLQDTQTGLRAIPLFWIPELLKIKSNKFDFELEALMQWSREHGAISQMNIETVYVDGNSTSHFNPLLDSLLIYLVFFRYSLASLSAAFLDTLVFAAVLPLFQNILAATITSRLIAGIYNYSVLKNHVFRSNKTVTNTLTGYVLTVIGLMCISYIAILGVHKYLGLGVITSKIAVEVTLFLVSYLVQSRFVFGRKSQTENLPANLVTRTA